MTSQRADFSSRLILSIKFVFESFCRDVQEWNITRLRVCFPSWNIYANTSRAFCFNISRCFQWNVFLIESWLRRCGLFFFQAGDRANSCFFQSSSWRIVLWITSNTLLDLQNEESWKSVLLTTPETHKPEAELVSKPSVLSWQPVCLSVFLQQHY